MSLSYTGNLGIGITNSSKNFHVIGNSTIDGDLDGVNNLTVDNDATIIGDLTVNGTLNASLDGLNLNATSGISTLNNIKVLNNATVASRLGINNEDPVARIQVGNTPLTSVIVTDGAIGIGTTVITPNPPGANIGLDAAGSDILVRGIAVGTKIGSSYADFSDTGKGLSGGIGRFLIVPKLTNAERNLLSVVPGALIFNIDDDKFQGYTGVGWTNFH